MTINGQDFGSVIVEDNVAFLDLGSYEIEIGDLITVTDGVWEKSLLFTFLMVTRIDRDMDMLYGVGTPGALVYASADGIWRSTTADSVSGAWEVDFSGVVDIQTDTEVSAQQRDDDGDSVWFDWQERPMWIEVTPEDDTIYGWDWMYGALVTVEVDDPSTPVNPDHIESATVGPSPWGSTWFVITTQDYDLKNGDIVTVSDGTTTLRTIVGDMDADGIPDEIDNAPAIFNPDQRDVDSDGLADVLDPCPDDTTNTCDPNRSSVNVIGVQGGAVTTPDGRVSLNIPAGSVNEYISFTITYKDGGYELASDRGPLTVVHSYSIQPNGTQFYLPASITFHWDDVDDDGIVDSTSIQEADLLLAKDGEVITSSCNTNPSCDMTVNKLTVEVGSLSLFALSVPVNQPPTADAGGPYFGREGFPISLDASNSTDPDDHIATYAWDMDGDGQFDEATGSKPKYAFPDNGVYTIHMLVTDQYGLQDVDEATVTVKNVAPVITFISIPSVIRAGSPASFLAKFMDVGFNDTFTAAWNWGDGTASAGVINGNQLTGSHTYRSPGVYVMTITVKDDDGGVGKSYALIVVLKKR